MPKLKCSPENAPIYEAIERMIAEPDGFCPNESESMGFDREAVRYVIKRLSRKPYIFGARLGPHRTHFFDSRERANAYQSAYYNRRAAAIVAAKPKVGRFAEDAETVIPPTAKFTPCAEPKGRLAGDYVPPSWQPSRAGANDFRSIASRGFI